MWRHQEGPGHQRITGRKQRVDTRGKPLAWAEVDPVSDREGAVYITGVTIQIGGCGGVIEWGEGREIRLIAGNHRKA